jgi:2-oxoglutarate dehydrogenase E2 component (dihydrolipoamide succinyltransferase)
MATDVVMPQMGESVAEGTVVRWIKKVGDAVERDEPLFEISTDKVDAEIPSPVAGILAEIRVKEGETVPVNSIVAVIGQAGEAHAPAPTPVAAPPPAPPPPAPVPQGNGGSVPADTAAPRQERPSQRREARTDTRLKAGPEPPPAGQVRPIAAAGSEIEARVRQRSSPLVRRIAKEHRIDISALRGTGIAGRVTKDDILRYLGSEREATVPRAAEPAASEERPHAPSAEPQAAAAGETTHVEPMSVMRRKIAEHMVLSRRTSAHVHSVFEVNFSRVAHIREARKAAYEDAGAKLTFLAFVVKAVVDALRAMPVVNASIRGDEIVYHKEINVGIAVALDWGLIVPVIKHADEKNLLGLSRAIADLAARARAKQLRPEEVAGGTFTITNPGVFGASFGMPIINQPQVAILGVGSVEKRPVVVDDAIAIRPMAFLTLGYDHRLIDGAVADRFMSHVKHSIENWDPVDA